MEQIAVISDIHGNLEALNTVINDIHNRNINKIICIGDIIAKGSNQEECVNIIKDNCYVSLKGNCDECYSCDMDLSKLSQNELNRINWVRNKLSLENIEYLKNLPYSYEFYLSGRLVRLFHSTPNKVDGFVGNIDKLDNIYKLFLSSENTISNNKADIVVYGHIHTPYIQKIYNRVVINTGSVGNAIDVFRNDEKDGNIKNTTVANYLILKGNYDSMSIEEMISYELISIPYDINKELESNKDNISLESYKEELLNGKYRNMNRINNFLESRGIDIKEI